MMFGPHFPAGIYPILDLDACQTRQVKPDDVIVQWKKMGWGPYQLRAKKLTAAEYAAMAEHLHARWMGTGPSGSANRWHSRPSIIANDFLEVAWHHSDWFCGIHLGRSDLESLSPREEQMLEQILDSGGIAGCSTHNAAEFRTALEEKRGPSGWSYVALGPVFPTESKTNSIDQNAALGPELVAEIVADPGMSSLLSQRQTACTAVLIGGMNPNGWSQIQGVLQGRIPDGLIVVPATIASVLDSTAQWQECLDPL